MCFVKACNCRDLCSAELLVSILDSFEAGIFKRRKIYLYLKNIHIPNKNYLIS